MIVRARGRLESRVAMIFARFPTLTLSADGASSGIFWADPSNHARAFRCRTRSFKVCGAFLGPATANGLLEYSDGDLADINLNGTGQIVTCKVRLVDSAGAAISGAECIQVWENGIVEGVQANNLIETCSWDEDDVPCGIEAVLSVAAGAYGTLAATWVLPAIVPCVFGAE